MKCNIETEDYIKST